MMDRVLGWSYVGTPRPLPVAPCGGCNSFLMKRGLHARCTLHQRCQTQLVALTRIEHDCRKTIKFPAACTTGPRQLRRAASVASIAQLSQGSLSHCALWLASAVRITPLACARGSSLFGLQVHRGGNTRCQLRQLKRMLALRKFSSLHVDLEFGKTSAQ